MNCKSALLLKIAQKPGVISIDRVLLILTSVLVLLFTICYFFSSPFLALAASA